jgi:hypothetical protein
VILGWIIIFNLVMLSKKIGVLNITPETSSVEFTSIINIKNISVLTIFLGIVELIMSLVALIIVEKRKVITIIKGS